ncbi:type II toxin-antitoxin system HicB family antitoxin [uncultured Fibrobacter sp.]|nr:type II toxin-antitoxin system HicB family antitoxin [uncultured Fibrobacter sp.]
MYEGLSDKEKEIASPRPFFPKKGVIMNYVARFFKDGDGIGVEFPDVPGAFTCADSMEEAKQMAKECLDGVLSVMLDRRDPLPEAKTKADPKRRLFPVFVDERLAIAYSVFEARRGKSAAEISRRMGISRQAYQRLEDPKSSISVSTLIKLAEALGKNLEVRLV